MTCLVTPQLGRPPMRCMHAGCKQGGLGGRECMDGCGRGWLEQAGAAACRRRAAVNAWMDAAVVSLDKLELQPVGEEAAAALSGGAAAHAEPKAKRWGKSRPYPARVITVEPLCNVANKNDKQRPICSCACEQSVCVYVPVQQCPRLMSMRARCWVRLKPPQSTAFEEVSIVRPKPSHKS
eukprot:1159068-Pelagomonas_calceolata.AAC.12